MPLPSWTRWHPAPRRASLTGEELEVANRVVAGERNREIAAALFVSEATVEARLDAGVPEARHPLAHRARPTDGRIGDLARRHLRYGRAAVAPDSLVGRDRELERLSRAVRTTGPRASSVLIRGEEGIGKTAVWRRGIEEHRSAGHRILVTRTSEDELHAPMTGLIDLLEEADPVGGPLDADADLLDRGRAVEQTLRALAKETPVVLAIDDLQWLDTVSLRSLRYAMRRLEGVPVSILATERTAGDRVAIVPADRSEEVLLGPLSRAALCAAVRAAVGALPQPSLDHICELSGGNPLFAIELARSWNALESLRAATPATLRATLAARIGDVTPQQLSMLRTAAALGPTTMSTLAAACDDPWTGTLLAEALDQELLVSGEDGLVRFAHPLLASVILDGTNPVERMALHARLADVVADPDGRARHLALSCSRRDPAVAAELESAAERAARLGAVAVAADFAAHSVRVTPTADHDSRADAHARRRSPTVPPPANRRGRWR